MPPLTGLCDNISLYTNFHILGKTSVLYLFIFFFIISPFQLKILHFWVNVFCVYVNTVRILIADLFHSLSFKCLKKDLFVYRRILEILYISWNFLFIYEWSSVFLHTVYVVHSDSLFILPHFFLQHWLHFSSLHIRSFFFHFF